MKRTICGLICGLTLLLNYSMSYGMNVTPMKQGQETNLYKVYKPSIFENSTKNDLVKNKKTLLNTGVPEDVLNELSDEQVNFISKNLSNDAKYESSENYILESENSDSNTLDEISTYSIESLAASQIKVSVVCFSVRLNGENLIEIFPSFYWLDKGTGINNDSFAFSLGNGWKVMTNLTAQMAVYVKYNDNSLSDSPVIYLPCVNNQNGCCYTIPRDRFTSQPNIRYEGHAIMYAKKEKSTAENKLYVKYIHDMSSNFSSYSVTLGPVSVSVTEADPARLGIYQCSLTFRYK